MYFFMTSNVYCYKGEEETKNPRSFLEQTKRTRYQWASATKINEDLRIATTVEENITRNTSLSRSERMGVGVQRYKNTCLRNVRVFPVRYRLVTCLKRIFISKNKLNPTMTV